MALAAFINEPYHGVQRMNSKALLFYFGVKPGYIDSLPIGSEFYIIYTDRWNVVQYRVASGDSDRLNIYVESMRRLESDEIEYFMELVNGLKND